MDKIMEYIDVRCFRNKLVTFKESGLLYAPF